ncbi:MCM2/3/5 family-domain-containing protein [Tribonema minus]|uniref:MCM2/3/5 family-domain-containing protein n=1 Tax=Tribonema minus TaxID=303371 RepID=A0A835Z090_9STRA|nr:MCM2/3/5 family-domain-containing protein [Tribonema minus]
MGARGEQHRRAEELPKLDFEQLYPEPDDFKAVLRRVLATHYATAIKELLWAPDPGKHYALTVNYQRGRSDDYPRFCNRSCTTCLPRLSAPKQIGSTAYRHAPAQDVIHEDPQVAYLLLHHYHPLFPLLDEALSEVQHELSDAMSPRGALPRRPHAPPPPHDGALLHEAPPHDAPPLSVKRNAHVRLAHLPSVSDLCKPNVSSIRNTDLNRVIQVQPILYMSTPADVIVCHKMRLLIYRIQGTVIRTGMVKMLEVTRQYQCQNKGADSVLLRKVLLIAQRRLICSYLLRSAWQTCGHTFEVACDMSQGNMLVPPRSCPGRGAPGSGGCKSSRFQEYGAHHYSDYQEIKVQEQVQKLGVGSIPRSIVAVLRDDLVDTCKAGDDVTITGTLLRRWRPVCPDARCNVEVTLLANGVQVNNSADSVTGCQVSDELKAEFEQLGAQHASTLYARRGSVSDELKAEFEQLVAQHASAPLALRNTLVASICPQIYGLFAVKLAVLLTLIGGVTETDSRGMRRRGTSHLLLIGDPGCGKSQFLRFAAKLSPRSVLTTGVGTTSAGLTCTAVKDGGEWMLEAGALVLADRGLCCIDEFSAIREHDRATIHEAMEQQTLSVAKAGLVCKLNTRTCVFAVTNPKGTYDMDESVTSNTAIGSPLLSRFDLVLLLLDTKDPAWDQMVSEFVLIQAVGAGRGGGASDGSDQQGRPASSDGARPWSIDRLQRYMAWVKETHPTVRLTEDAEQNGGFGRVAHCVQRLRPVHVRLAAAAYGLGEEQRDGSAVLAMQAARLLEHCCCRIALRHALAPWRLFSGGERVAVLSSYYQHQRRCDNKAAPRTTVRLLESLIRLAQAHARLMGRGEVALADAVQSVACVETSLHSCNLLGPNSVMHSGFPVDADAQFKMEQRLILDRLGLNHLGGDPPPTAPDNGRGHYQGGPGTPQRQVGGSQGGGPQQGGWSQLGKRPAADAYDGGGGDGGRRVRPAGGGRSAWPDVYRMSQNRNSQRLGQ